MFSDATKLLLLLRTLSGSPNVTVCSCVGLGLGLGNRVLGLGIGFREWVPIRNIIGGAAGAHIPMTFGLPLSACVVVCIRQRILIPKMCIRAIWWHKNGYFTHKTHGVYFTAFYYFSVLRRRRRYCDHFVMMYVGTCASNSKNHEQ